MTRSQVFFAPGRWLIDFGLSLLNLSTLDVETGLYWLMSLIAACVFWAYVIKIVVAIIKKAFGFDQRRR